MAEGTKSPQVQPGLEANAIGFVDAISIGLNATSPAYSLAAVLGPIVVLVGVAAPGVLLASFIPMLLIASAFYFLNRVDPDCGTTFSWVTRAMGPWFGWMGGWAIAMTGVLVVGSLADVGVKFTLLMFGQDELAANQTFVMVLAVGLILLMTWICVIGTELSGRVQTVLNIAQVVALIIFASVAILRGATGNGLPGAELPTLEWLNPFAAGTAALSAGLLLGVFAYWGWESAVNLNEETTDSSSTPGRAAIVSTFILLATYLGVAIAVLMLVGPAFLADNAGEEEMAFALIAREALGGWGWIVLLAVAMSAVASTQTTIIPASRTALSMARRTAIPAYFGQISSKHRTPAVSTWWVAIVAIVWYVVASLISENALFDSLTALSLLIAFYYSLTGIACAVYYRKLLLTSAKSFFLIGLGPVIGAVMLIWLLGLSVVEMSNPENSYGGVSWFGLGPPLVIGIFLFALGIVFMVASRIADRPFWKERPSVVNPDLVPISEGGGRAMSLAVGYNGGESARHALQAAIALARDLEETLLVVCGVAPAGGMGEEYDITEEAIVEELAPAVNEAVMMAREAGVDAEGILVDADPVGALETIMEERKPRMLVVGYGESGRIRAALFGAVAPKLVDRADIPVLVVP